MGALLRDLKWRASARWHYLKEDTHDWWWSKKFDFWKWYAYHFQGWRPPPEPTEEEKERTRKQLQPLIDALSAGSYQVAGSDLISGSALDPGAPVFQGGPLKVESLEATMACVTFDGPPQRLRGETKLSFWARSRWYLRKFLRLSFVYVVDAMPEPPPPEFYPWWPVFLRGKLPVKKVSNGR